MQCKGLCEVYNLIKSICHFTILSKYFIHNIKENVLMLLLQNQIVLIAWADIILNGVRLAKLMDPNSIN